jgi:arginyl-tRNA synthetase
MADITESLATRIREALLSCASEMDFDPAVLPEVLLERPKRKDQGDWSTNVAMQLARTLRKNPRDVAAKLCGHIPVGDGIARTEVAGPGFVNFFLTDSWMSDTVATVLREEETYGRSDTGGGRRVQVEFVSANPTGPLHVGHGRGAAVGDIVARILDFSGYSVQREYYINDAGLQMSILGRSTQARYFELLGKGERAPFPEDGYKGAYIYDLAQAVIAEKGDSLLALPLQESLPYFRQFAGDRILATIRSDLSDFGVRFDVWFSEKDLYVADDVPKTMEFLKNRDFAFEHEGALWFKATGFTDEKDRVLIRSNGVPTYFASDITYHKNKFDRGFSKVIDIWGADHHGYVPRMKAAVEALGRDPEDLSVLLIQFVNLLRDGTPVAMSTRSGEFVTLREVLDEVGVDATRYFFVMRRSDSHLDFDLELAKQQSNENPVYYIQYAHARIRSVLRETEARGIPLPDPAVLRGFEYASDEEKRLVATLDSFPKEVGKASRELAPHVIASYAYSLAGDFHSFYNAHRILGEEEKIVKARLLLVRATGIVLGSALRLLGVSAPEKM